MEARKPAGSVAARGDSPCPRGRLRIESTPLPTTPPKPAAGRTSPLIEQSLAPGVAFSGLAIRQKVVWDRTPNEGG